LLSSSGASVLRHLSFEPVSPCRALRPCVLKLAQWLHGTSLLPRGPPFPRQPAEYTIRSRRHHGLQDPGTGHPHCAPGPRDSRCRQGSQRVCFFHLNNPGGLWRADCCPLCSVREATPRPENQLLLTKGDNNYLDDVELYQGLDWLERKHIVGKVRGSVLTRDDTSFDSHTLFPQILALYRLRDYCHGTSCGLYLLPQSVTESPFAE